MFPARLIIIFLFLLFTKQALAITDPLEVPNNKLGIHILFTDEIEKASRLVNNESRGEWGYVVIPIQNTDRNRVKWQQFFDKCKEQKVIPIIRVATSADGSHWELPTQYDLVDFANFLNDLSWPTENRYLIMLNEVNRADEYGGKVDPEGYADFLNMAIDIFKEKSEDFFILPAGLDNAASDRKTSLKWNLYLNRMYKKQPDIFNKIDGWVSHAYPNPDFSVRPDLKGENKINSFETDIKLLNKFTSKKLPIFITETGWSGKYLSEKQIGFYYVYAFEHVWNNPQIVTVAPFILNAQDGPFAQFSFINTENQFKEFASTYSSFATIGSPKIKTISPTPTPRDIFVSTPSSEVLGVMSSKNILEKLYNSFIKLFSIFQ